MPTFTADIFWNGGNTISVFFFYLFRLSPFLDAPWKRWSCARNCTMQQIFQNKMVSILIIGYLAARCTPGCEVPTDSSGPQRSSCSWSSCCTRMTGCPWGKRQTPLWPPGGKNEMLLHHKFYEEEAFNRFMRFSSKDWNVCGLNEKDSCVQNEIIIYFPDYAAIWVEGHVITSMRLPNNLRQTGRPLLIREHKETHELSHMCHIDVNEQWFNHRPTIRTFFISPLSNHYSNMTWPNL